MQRIFTSTTANIGLSQWTPLFKSLICTCHLLYCFLLYNVYHAVKTSQGRCKLLMIFIFHFGSFLVKKNIQNVILSFSKVELYHFTFFLFDIWATTATPTLIMPTNLVCGTKKPLDFYCLY